MATISKVIFDIHLLKMSLIHFTVENLHHLRLHTARFLVTFVSTLFSPHTSAPFI